MNFNATLIGQTIAFLVFVWFCMKYIWPFIMGAIEERQVEIADGLAAAEKGQNSLAEANTEAGKIITAARDQAKGIMDQASSQAADTVEAAKAEGEAEKQRLLGSARAEIDVEVNRARDELRAQVAAIAMSGAEQILAREISPDAHRELLDRLANDL